jgi:phosphoadenosine phosphosulfate reductase
MWNSDENVWSSMTLFAKTEQALSLLTSLYTEYGPERIAVAWTGGKDSTVALHLWLHVLKQQQYQARPRVLNLDTGVKFPEVLAFRDTLSREWKLDMVVATPAVDLATHPIAVDKVSCCAELKVEPLSRAVADMGVEVLLTGIRRDEHPDRDRPVKERREKPDCLMVHTILEFTEMDVWAYTVEHKLPWCSLYGEGYRSLGCVPCTQKSTSGSERAGRAAAKEENMQALKELGYF